MLNEQPTEKKSKDTNGEMIEVVDIFNTIQGEGPFVGSPAVFVRLAGCNFQCPACDTDYTSHRRFVHISNIMDTVRGLRPNGLVVLTGGEPFRQAIGQLIRVLIINGQRVQVETNGTLYQPDCPYKMFSIVCSPKSAVINNQLRPYINALKYVVQAGYTDPDDGLPTMVLGMKVKAAKPEGMLTEDIYIQPADEQDPKKNAANLSEALAICMKFGYRLCTQQHKIIGLP